jgi:hypothetical protein
MGHRGPLLDRHRGREAAHGLDVRPLHLLEELTRPWGEALDEATLSLGVERVEGEAALPRARRAGDHHEAVPGDVAVDAPEIVDSGTPNRDRLVPEVVLHGQPKETF